MKQEEIKEKVWYSAPGRYLFNACLPKFRNGDTACALADENAVRATRTAYGAPPPPVTAMTLNLLFRERGFEFYWEMVDHLYIAIITHPLGRLV